MLRTIGFPSAIAAVAGGAVLVSVPQGLPAKRFIPSEAPLAFVENRGQLDSRVAYVARARSHLAYFTAGGHRLRLADAGAPGRAHAVSVEFLGSTVIPQAVGPVAGVVSEFRGPAAHWRSAIPAYAGIRYEDAWRGVDVDYRYTAGSLESLFTIEPGADPSAIRLRYAGQDSLALDAQGNLVYETSVGKVTETAPVAYQDIAGARIPVAGRYALLDRDTVGFEVVAYDRAHALVIDPMVLFSGFIGGSQGDNAHAVAVDGAGNAYVAGRSASGDDTFPETSGPQPSFGGGAYDAFVTKVGPTGTLVYSVFMGGGGSDDARGIAVDGSGNAYIVGTTTSLDGSFPVSGGPDTSANGGLSDVFVAKLNASGTALVYSGFIGGSGEDIGAGIDVDIAGNAYVGGTTASTEASFPVTVGPSLAYSDGGYDAFVAKVNVSGSALDYAGYVGGASFDTAYGLAVDGSGRAHLTGLTMSTEASFPVAVGPDLAHNGSADAYVARVSASGDALEYAGYIGGTEFDFGAGVAVDQAGDAYVTGVAASSGTQGFPVAGGPQLEHNGDNDAFITKVSGATAGILYSGYFGGTSTEGGNAIAVDAEGRAHIAGGSGSTDLPVVDGPDLTQNGGGDAFVAQLSADGMSLVFASYFGGSSDELAQGIAVDSDGGTWIAGTTSSTQASFPTTGGPDGTANGGDDAFVARIGEPREDGDGTTIGGGGAGGAAAASALAVLALVGGLRRRWR